MLELILALVGAFFGGLIEDEEGLIVGGLLGLALGLAINARVRVNRQAKEIAALRERLDAVAADLPPVEFDFDMPASEPGRPTEAEAPADATTTPVPAGAGAPGDRVCG